LVLQPAEQGVEHRVAPGVQAREPEAGVRLVDRAVCLDPRIGLADRLAGRQPGAAAVARAGVDAVERHHGLASPQCRVRHQSAPISTATAIAWATTRSRISLLESDR